MNQHDEIHKKLTLELIREQYPDMADKIFSAKEWILSRPWADNILFIILYGSVARGQAMNHSDIDLAIGMKKTPADHMAIRKEIVLKRPYDELDIRLFDQLPMYIQKDVLNGIILYCDDMGTLHDLAYDFIKRYRRFQRYLDDYLGIKPLV